MWSGKDWPQSCTSNCLHFAAGYQELQNSKHIITYVLSIRYEEKNVKLCRRISYEAQGIDSPYLKSFMSVPSVVLANSKNQNIRIIFSLNLR